MTVGGKIKQSRMDRDFSCKTAVTCDYDVDRAKDLAVRIRHTYLTAMVAASAALASTLLPHHRLPPTVLTAAGSSHMLAG